jgi:hypothetical protein
MKGICLKKRIEILNYNRLKSYRKGYMDGIRAGNMVNHVPEVRKMVEISDEEIMEYAKKNAFQYYEFIAGAKWYREQLKQPKK